MPRWTRDEAALGARYPDDRWIATCARADAPLLLRYDHHVVWIAGRPALLLTYAWAADGVDVTPDPLVCTVSFTYPRGHPRAPHEVQAIVDRLTFGPAPAPDLHPPLP